MPNSINNFSNLVTDLPEFLFRALRIIEVENGNVLIPKSTQPFIADPLIGIDMVLPISFGSTENAARQHNWKQNGYATRGISTTPFLDRAEVYAKQNKVIVRIETAKFSDFGIKVYRINSLRYGIAVPEDDEHLLVYEKDGAFPGDIIVETIYL